MARTRRANARGTRRSSGIESGVTWATNPSGVTIDGTGINAGDLLSLAELNYLNGSVGYVMGNATAGKLITSGVSYWAGTTLTLATGLTTISSIICSIINEGNSTQALEVKLHGINGGAASAAIYTTQWSTGVSITSTTNAPGCSIAFIAFGV